MQTRFVALVPVKSPDRGKSRLAGVTDDGRRALALAFALDTLEAVRATPGIAATIVVTSDDVVAGEAGRRGCLVVDDAGDLNLSLASAVAAAPGVGADDMVVAVCADLPALRPDDLADALAQVEPGRPAFVADALGTGTTTYAAPAGRFDPRFGPGSAAAHADAGARAVDGALDTLRQDVDTLEELRDLADRGLLGRLTTEVLGKVALPVD